MLEGQYLGRPPVDLSRSIARAQLASMLRGGASYGRAAGLGAPLAMPRLQPLPRWPSSPNASPEITTLYPPSMSLAKLNLRQRFGIK